MKRLRLFLSRFVFSRCFCRSSFVYFQLAYYSTLMDKSKQREIKVSKLFFNFLKRKEKYLCFFLFFFLSFNDVYASPLSFDQSFSSFLLNRNIPQNAFQLERFTDSSSLEFLMKFSAHQWRFVLVQILMGIAVFG